MQDLTFGEQVKIVLSRKNMTIKELAKKIEIRTKKKMSRQNLTQRLGRDNFQEQDMRMITEILGCPFHLNILDDFIPEESAENTVNAENIEKAENTVDAENIEKTEDTVNAEDIEKTEDTVNAENIKKTEDTVNVEYTEKMENREETQNHAAGIEVKEEETRTETAEANTATKTHERDITIGELVDIHEELDAMMEMATGKLPDVDVKEHEAEKPTKSLQDKTQETSQETPQEAPQETGESGQDDYQFAAESGQEHMEEGGGEPVEHLLEEIETIEKEGKREEKSEEKQEKQETQEEKSHGWRAYLKQRLKKRAKDQEQNKESIAAEKPSYINPLEQTNQEEGYVRGTYSESHMGNGYAENSYTENGYAENSYIESGYMEEDYMYSEAAYAEDVPPEDEEKGERNPYTGKEYESNSVRMHPSRIGYVQVYDRSNHEWTDMTEWAFLGYQERKKQLLGKDYDPPIYLD